MKRVLIIGSDGYIGYPLTYHLLENDYLVMGVDNFSRRKLTNSLTPISSPEDREEVTINNFDNFLGTNKLDLANQEHYRYLLGIIRIFKPHAIVHLGEQPSAPFSMIDSRHAYATQLNNTLGTLNLLWAIKEAHPRTHLIKLGTLGEYGTPDCDIPEGRIPKNCLGIYGTDFDDPDFEDKVHQCPMSGLLFPRTAGSFYHLSKVHDTLNIEFACRNWGLTSTDIMQGVVFGLNENCLTRFDYDEHFGTVINRFCVQALCNHPLTVYGKGKQTRGFLPLKDSIQCLTLAIDNPPEHGTYRTFNQLENIYKIKDLAEIVVNKALDMEINATIEHLDNPRNEAEEHYYNPTYKNLIDLGYQPTTNIGSEIYELLKQLEPHKHRINTKVIKPKTLWR